VIAMIGDFVRLLAGETALHVRNYAGSAIAVLIAALLGAVAMGLATAAAYSALWPEIGDAWTAALLAGVYLALALVVLAIQAMRARRLKMRQIAMARARAAAVPPVSPELMLVAAAAGALFSLGSKTRGQS